MSSPRGGGDGNDLYGLKDFGKYADRPCTSTFLCTSFTLRPRNLTIALNKKTKKNLIKIIVKINF